jgi:mannosyl-3-phosphoglycerate phosphatase
MTKFLKLAVFTDLDGTLLDHNTYSWDAARPALDRLVRLQCPIVLASSKTAAEVLALQDSMALSGQPALVENGSGLIGLSGAHSPRSYAALRQTLDLLPANLRAQFNGFGDMSGEELSSLTGLSPEAAALAKARDYSEPGLWTGNEADLETFAKTLVQHGVFAQRGGRFLTLSFGRTKADAMAEIIRTLKPDVTLALGDAPNDVAMLEQADFGVIVANPHHAPLPRLRGETEGRIIRTQEPGPLGWNVAVNTILDTLFPEQGHMSHG